jgi:hypothetical protein
VSRLTRIDKKGYRMVKTRWGWEREHRLVAANMLGRSLTEKEVVHHRDGNKLNNSRRNLQVCASQSEHNALHGHEGSQKRLTRCE